MALIQAGYSGQEAARIMQAAATPFGRWFTVQPAKATWPPPKAANDR